MEPNVDRGMWSVVALLAAIVIGGVVLLAFPRISGKIANSMDDTVNKAFKGETPRWAQEDIDLEGYEKLEFSEVAKIIDKNNLINSDSIKYTGNVDFYKADENSFIMDLSGKYSGVYFQLDQPKDGYIYKLSYEYEELKLDGRKLVSFGNHTDLNWLPVSVNVDGKFVRKDAMVWDSTFTPGTGKHKVDVEMLYKQNYKEGTKYDSGNIYIQPNRGYLDSAIVKISNVKITEVKKTDISHSELLKQDKIEVKPSDRSSEYYSFENGVHKVSDTDKLKNKLIEIHINGDPGTTYNVKFKVKSSAPKINIRYIRFVDDIHSANTDIAASVGAHSVKPNGEYIEYEFNVKLTEQGGDRFTNMGVIIQSPYEQGLEVKDVEVRELIY